MVFQLEPAPAPKEASRSRHGFHAGGGVKGRQEGTKRAHLLEEFLNLVANVRGFLGKDLMSGDRNDP
jgi:hypothetical protein